MWNRIKCFWGELGPGLIAGASDNDPAGISTYVVGGATTGYRYLWLSLISLPVMIAVQDMSARIGTARMTGLGRAIMDTFGRRWLSVALFALVIVNVTTLGADIAGVAAGFDLLTGVGIHWFVVPVALFVVAVQMFWSYRVLARYLRYLTLALVAYILAGLVSGPDWLQVLKGTLIPTLAWNRQGLEVMVGVIGTTLSPYMFFWQASEEVEELHARQEHRTRGGTGSMERERLFDTAVGMSYAMIIFYFIVLTSAATLHKEHITSVRTAADAARALRPIAGDNAFLLFSVGIIGSGLISIPVLAGSTAHPIAEWIGAPAGLDQSLRRAKCFYGVLTASVLVGMAIALLPINPIDALFYSQVLMGLLTPVLLILMTLIARNKSVMGEEYANGLFSNIFGWIAIGLLVFADVAMLWMLMR
ncbi:MAG: divalent metal cation transporter [Armatimonadota bacterium]|nr:divalent metal cation transporter [bacterium]